MSDLSTLARLLRGPLSPYFQTSYRLPYAPRVLNPFPLASSGGAAGDFPQSREIVLLAFNISVYVDTTNNGGNYWTIVLVDSSIATLASLTTSAIGANATTRLSAASITQPGAANPWLTIVPIATGSPGTIYLVPEVIARDSGA